MTEQSPRGWYGLVAAALFVSVLPAGALAQGVDNPAPAADSTANADTSDGILGTLPVPPVTFSAFVDLAEGYSTNAQGRGGGGGDDTFTRGRLGANLHYDKPRLQADLAYTLSAQYWSRTHRQNHISQHLNLSSRLTVIPEMLFISANAFATPTELTRVGDLSAGGEPVSRNNSRDTYGYTVRPELLFRFQDYLTSSTSASHGGVFFVRPSTNNTGSPPPITPAKDAYSTTLTQQFKSGTYFERLQWTIVGSYSQFSQTTRSQRQMEGVANLTYALTHALRVFATGGYSDYKSSAALTKDLSGPTALGGFTYTLGPDFEFTAEAGTQHNFPTYMGSARWKITPLTMLIAQATDEVTTPQGDILNRLGNGGGLGGGMGGIGGAGGIGGGLGLGSFGGGSPFGQGGLALDNSIYRVRSIEASLTHTEDRTTYTASLFGTERDRLDVVVNSPFPTRTSVYGIRGVVSHRLNANLSGSVSAAFSRSNEFGGHDHIFSADAQANYQLSDTISLYLTDHFIHRDSAHLISIPNRALTEDQVIIGIRATF